MNLAMEAALAAAMIALVIVAAWLAAKWVDKTPHSDPGGED